MNPLHLSKGCAFFVLAALCAACNPFDTLDPSATSAAGHTATNDMCLENANLGRCPPPPPKDFLP